MERIMSTHNNLKDYSNRVNSVRLVRHDDFVPEGQKEPIIYYQLVLDVTIDDEPTELTFKCPADKATLLKAASYESRKNLLDD